MRIFLAGATGALGKRLVPLLVSAGHSVAGMTRSAGKAAGLIAAGCEPIVADALNREEVMRVVMHVGANVVVHQMTAIAKMPNLKKFDEEFKRTNQLRTEGTENLLAAARASGAQRFVVQSYTGWPNARTGSSVKTEEDPLDTDPPEVMKRSLQAIRSMEETVSGIRDLTGIVLRYGSFTGREPLLRRAPK